jgi:hypothetical protein
MRLNQVTTEVSLLAAVQKGNDNAGAEQERLHFPKSRGVLCSSRDRRYRTRIFRADFAAFLLSEISCFRIYARRGSLAGR